MQATLPRRWTPKPMPTFTPGWNFATVVLVLVALIGAGGAIIVAFVTSRYSLLSKILESKDSDKKIANESAQSMALRFDTMDVRQHAIEAELHSARAENLTARQEILAVKQENAALREENSQLKLIMQTRDVEYKAAMVSRDEEVEQVKAENRRLSGECESLRRRIQQLHPVDDLIE